MNVKTLQGLAMTSSALLVPLVFSAERWLMASKAVLITVVVLIYAVVITALGSTIVLYQREHRIFLPKWRRISYAVALGFLVLLCISPAITWTTATGSYHGGPSSRDYLFLTLFGMNVSAIMLIWFGRGWWSRLGLLVVSLWILLLWAFPLGVGV